MDELISTFGYLLLYVVFIIVVIRECDCEIKTPEDDSDEDI